jgi:hypothetical protein
MLRRVNFLWTLIILLLGIVGGLSAKLFMGSGVGFAGQENYYAAVYVDSGEIYFGKLTTTPGLTLSNVHFLEKDTSGNYVVSKFTDALYAPSETLRLNPDKVIWISRLKEDSQLMKTLKNGT